MRHHAPLLLVMAGLVGMLTATARTALAVPLTTGETVSPLPGDDAFPSGSPIDTEVENFTGVNSSMNAVFHGTVTSEVFVDPVTEDLDFAYRVVDTDPEDAGWDSIERITLSSFATFSTDVDYVRGTGDVAPYDATRAANSRTFTAYSGPTIGFDTVGIAPSDTTTWLVIDTDATEFTDGNGAFIDGGTGDAVVDVPMITSNNAIPEPTSFALLAVVAGLWVRGRRHRKSA